MQARKVLGAGLAALAVAGLAGVQQDHVYETGAVSYTSQSTENWSGVEYHGLFKSVGATWHVRCTAGQGDFSQWVGMDDKSVVQAGTDSDPAASLPYAWVELYPAPPVVLYNVNCGDRMNVRVSRYSVTINDTTLGDKDVQPINYTGPQITAEVIDEAPGYGKLANFSQSTFTGIKVSGKVTGQVLETLSQPGNEAVVTKFTGKTLTIKQEA